MADNNPETVLKLLNVWRAIIKEETEALSHGDIQQIEILFQKTVEIQQYLGNEFSSPNTLNKNKQISKTIKALQDEQERFIESLRAQAEDLANEIGSLGKSQASLKGYKQNLQAPPRFMNKHT